jgi:two-component system, LytTR family, sensor kinase
MHPPHHELQADDRFRLRPSEMLGVLVFWAFLAALTATGRMLDPRVPNMRPEVSAALISLSFIEYALWAALTLPIVWITGRMSGSGLSRGMQIAGLVVVGVIVAILVDTVLGRIRMHLLPLPRPRPAPPLFSNVIRFEFLDDLMVYFAVLGAALARNYFIRYQARVVETRQLQAETAQLQAQLAEAQLNVLRTQLNPHFLFNTLHAISSLVERDPRGVRRMIARLSDLLRHTLEQTSEQEIPLERELELLRRYFDIMEIRFEGRLEITMDVPAELGAALVPNLILQPLAENALKHGVSAMDAPGRVTVTARRAGDSLLLQVEDNGPGPGSESGTSEHGLGLRNTLARLRQLYGTKQQFALRRAPRGGTIAEIRLPFRTAAR